jgi:hypothetical protein
MTDENDLLRTLPLEDQLRIAAVDLAVTRAPRALVEAVWFAAVSTPVLLPLGPREHKVAALDPVLPKAGR